MKRRMKREGEWRARKEKRRDDESDEDEGRWRGGGKERRRGMKKIEEKSARMKEMGRIERRKVA